MMRIAFISDLHADVHALEDALKQIDRMGCDLIVCLGDLVDGGLFPNELIALLRERHIPCIRGNHDRWAIGNGSAAEPMADVSAVPHDATGADLSGDSVRFLAALPVSWSSTVGSTRVAAHHARPGSDMHGIYPDLARDADLCRLLDESEADVLVVGHTHIAFCIEVSARGLVVNPGALLRTAVDADSAPHLFDPTTGKFHQMPLNFGGTFGVLEVARREFRVYAASDGAEVSVPRMHCSS